MLWFSKQLIYSIEDYDKSSIGFQDKVNGDQPADDSQETTPTEKTRSATSTTKLQPPDAQDGSGDVLRDVIFFAVQVPLESRNEAS